MTSSRPAVDARAPARLRDLFAELGDLKRVRSAGRNDSIAQRGFRSAWAALVAGEQVETVMRRTVAAALAAARLGDLDGVTLTALGLEAPSALSVLRAAFDAVEVGVDASLASDLRVALDLAPRLEGPVPAFVVALEAQPRAGATCPGKPRLVLQPAENHAEHCWAVAVFGVLLAPVYGADATTVFLAALAHHLNNAAMPDSGFTGEMLLGAHLGAVCDHATALALAQLDKPLRQQTIQARKILPDVATPEGQAFHAADVIDRVMEIAQHLKASAVTIGTVLDDLGLVHEGPVKPFHDRVLVEMGLP